MSDHTSDLPQTKTCRICGIEKPRGEFTRAAGNRDGLRSECRPCVSEYNKQYRKANRERLCQYDRQYYAANRTRHYELQRVRRIATAEHNREYSRHWRALNRERLNEYSRRYAKRHPERVKQNKRRWNAANPDKVRAQQHRSRAYRRNAEGSFASTDIERQREAQKGKCYYCGKKRNLTIEHIVPLARGGTNDPSNIVLACKSCNSSKCDKLPHEWGKGGKLL